MSKVKVKNQARKSKSPLPPLPSPQLKSSAAGDLYVMHDFDVGDALPISYVNTLSVHMCRVGNEIQVAKLRATITPFAGLTYRQK